VKFDDVWRHLAGIKGTPCHTLDQRHPFTMVELTGTQVVVRVDRTGKLRPIPRGHFEEAWRRLVQLGQLSRNEIHDEISRFNPAYVASLLTKVPGVSYRLSPIVLLLSGDTTTAAPGAAVLTSADDHAEAAPSVEDDDPDALEESVVDRLASIGQQLGFDAVKEWRTDLGSRIDLVWARSLPRNLPGLADFARLPVVGFEVETSLRSRKHVKGDIFNLQDLSPALGVIVLCRGANDREEQLVSLRSSGERYIKRLGLRMQIWSDGDVDRLAAWIRSASQT